MSVLMSVRGYRKLQRQSTFRILILNGCFILSNKCSLRPSSLNPQSQLSCYLAESTEEGRRGKCPQRSSLGFADFGIETPNSCVGGQRRYCYTTDLCIDTTLLALTRALRARRARPPEVAEKLCSRARSVRKHLVR